MGGSKEYPISDHAFAPCGCGDGECHYCAICKAQKCFHMHLFEPKCDEDFDLLCECGHSYDNHVWSEKEYGSDCEYVTCSCTNFRLKEGQP